MRALALSISVPTAAAFVALASCVSESPGEPCTADGRCLYGYQCVSGLCQACALDECETSQITLLSSGGGLACDREGTCVRFPPGALLGITEIEVARTNNPNEAIGAPPLSKVYAVRPASLLPSVPVEVTFRVSRQVDAREQVTIQRAVDPRGPWESLPTQRDSTQASAYSQTLGFFALGRARDTPIEPVRDGGTVVIPDGDGGTVVVVPTDPIPGISVPMGFPGPLTSLRGLAWDPVDRRMIYNDQMTGNAYAFAHVQMTAEQPNVLRTGLDDPFGVAVDAAGQILLMELGLRRIVTIDRQNMLMPLVDSFQGQRLNGPVDAAIRADGTVYFTDPGLGLALTGEPRQLMFNGLFRREPAQGNLTVEWQGSMLAEPRGVELSPDERTLYVADSASNILGAWDVREDGSLTNRRTFVTVMGMAPDGITVDRDGNVYVGTAAGIEVFGADGRRWGNIPIPERVGSLAWSGPGLTTLWATTSSALYVMTVTVPGAR